MKNADWFDFREFPFDGKSEKTFIRAADITLVSYVENGDEESYSVLVTAFGKQYLHTCVETLTLADSEARELIKAISMARSGKCNCHVSA